MSVLVIHAKTVQLVMITWIFTTAPVRQDTVEYFATLVRMLRVYRKNVHYVVFWETDGHTDSREINGPERFSRGRWDLSEKTLRLWTFLAPWRDLTT